MEVSYKRADVAGTVLLGVLPLALPYGLNVCLQPFWPVMETCVIDAVDLPSLRDFDVGVGKQELATQGVQGEPVGALQA